jgi:hypothetical protein
MSLMQSLLALKEPVLESAEDTLQPPFRLWAPGVEVLGSALLQGPLDLRPASVERTDDRLRPFTLVDIELARVVGVSEGGDAMRLDVMFDDVHFGEN